MIRAVSPNSTEAMGKMDPGDLDRLSGDGIIVAVVLILLWGGFIIIML